MSLFDSSIVVAIRHHGESFIGANTIYYGFHINIKVVVVTLTTGTYRGCLANFLSPVGQVIKY